MAVLLALIGRAAEAEAVFQHILRDFEHDEDVLSKAGEMYAVLLSQLASQQFVSHRYDTRYLVISYFTNNAQL